MSDASPGILRRICRSGWRGKALSYCLLPTVTIICLAESVIRFGGFDKPLAGSIFFGNPGTNDVLHRSDATLFYSLRPDVQTRWQGGSVTTNSLGLRCSEIGPKQENEFRILSLGESSTFGARVDDDQTYSAQLENLLNASHDQKSYKVINGGVSGYTSFQSLKYLETRGLNLHPDLLLFYHEQNDFLPTVYSDREIYESRSHGWHRVLADYSAVYRVISNALARRRIETSRTHDKSPDLAQETDSSDRPQLEQGIQRNSNRSRVSIAERLDNLARLVEICRANDVDLVVIHPAYAESKPHSCELTEFCEANGVAMYEAYDALHPEGVGAREYFADECHPNEQGHMLLATGLHEFLVTNQLLVHDEPTPPDFNGGIGQGR